MFREGLKDLDSVTVREGCVFGVTSVLREGYKTRTV